jgi:enoyl-CoA hydratase/carnithine racemase
MPDALPTLPHLALELDDGLLRVAIDRPTKRNAINDALIESLNTLFSHPPTETRVAVLTGLGDHFSAGLDLSEHREREPLEVLRHSQAWQATFHQIEFGGLPVVAALHGAVIGGGLELALAAHVRVAEPSTFYQLPEGRRGIFVGGGASVRVARVLGADRTREMMLTGRRYAADEGQRLGLSHYLVEPGAGYARACALARRVAANAPVSNFMMLTALARIDNMAMTEGLFTESLAAALTQTSSHAREGMQAFLDKRDRDLDDD